MSSRGLKQLKNTCYGSRYCEDISLRTSLINEGGELSFVEEAEAQALVSS